MRWDGNGPIRIFPNGFRAVTEQLQIRYMHTVFTACIRCFVRNTCQHSITVRYVLGRRPCFATGKNLPRLWTVSSICFYPSCDVRLDQGFQHARRSDEVGKAENGRETWGSLCRGRGSRGRGSFFRVSFVVRVEFLLHNRPNREFLAECGQVDSFLSIASSSLSVVKSPESIASSSLSVNAGLSSVNCTNSPMHLLVFSN